MTNFIPNRNLMWLNSLYSLMYRNTYHVTFFTLPSTFRYHDDDFLSQFVISSGAHISPLPCWVSSYPHLQFILSHPASHLISSYKLSHLFVEVTAILSHPIFSLSHLISSYKLSISSYKVRVILSHLYSFLKSSYPISSWLEKRTYRIHLQLITFLRKSILNSKLFLGNLSSTQNFSWEIYLQLKSFFEKS